MKLKVVLMVSAIVAFFDVQAQEALLDKAMKNSQLSRMAMMRLKSGAPIPLTQEVTKEKQDLPSIVFKKGNYEVMPQKPSIGEDKAFCAFVPASNANYDTTKAFYSLDLSLPIIVKPYSEFFSEGQASNTKNLDLISSLAVKEVNGENWLYYQGYTDLNLIKYRYMEKVGAWEPSIVQIQYRLECWAYLEDSRFGFKQAENAIPAQLISNEGNSFINELRYPLTPSQWDILKEWGND
ncbi:hypothetical protein MRY82_06755 [bacterium]|nr:hypothetical protein [bacterium]